ncbi:MAG TPA: trypsin-like peptidase domain-containing protein, partial [Vicinamibacteria bacterium]|nr:trypsin-like peptidase domain-containing protein [Vicinamibacteria bacterium]
LFEREGEVVLVDSGSPEGTRVGGRAVEEVVLAAGDVIELGPGGPRLRVERGAAAATVAAEPPLSQTMIARVVRRTSRPFWVAIVLLAAAAAAALVLTQRQARRMEAEVGRLRQEMARSEAERRALGARVLEEKRRAETERASLEDQLAAYRAREEDLGRRMAEAATGEVQTLRQELETTRERIATLESERQAGERIIRQYGAGVALIQGSYAFFDAQGRPLREATEGDGEEGEEGQEPTVRTVDYYGTGFLVDARGMLLTNRHVAEPWWNDAPAEALRRKGYEPRFVSFRAFFPGHQSAFELKVEKISEKVDLALVRVALQGRRVPVLPLARSRNSAVAGQPVVVVGYPTGLEAILAKTETSVVKSILDSHGAEPERVTEALSRRGLIRPSTTQGHIGDITRSDIVFDAPSAQGGSGGPVFNKHGEVIAVEYAVLPKFGGNSFGIPVSYVLELLRETATAAGD